MTALVDDHAHPFPSEPDRLDLGGITLGRGRIPSSLAAEAIRVRLARFLGCEADEVESARDERAAADWPGYVRSLLADAAIEAVLLDGGPERVDLAAQGDLTGTAVHELVRIEAVVDPLLEQGADADAVLARVADLVSTAAAEGAAGLKTVLAYRTGLRVDPATTLEQARRSVDGPVDDGQPVRRRAKALRDLVLLRTLEQCAELDLPIQVHTGIGDSDLRLADAEPVLLDDLLRSPVGEAAPVVLIHGGFPWHEQLAYLAMVRPRVWAEYSLGNLVSPATTADRLLRMVDLAPTDRLLLGTDGHGTPETHWFAASVLHEAWAEVRIRLSGWARTSWLDEVEQRIFADNALELYRWGT